MAALAPEARRRTAIDGAATEERHGPAVRLVRVGPVHDGPGDRERRHLADRRERLRLARRAGDAQDAAVGPEDALAVAGERALGAGAELGDGRRRGAGRELRER